MNISICSTVDISNLGISNLDIISNLNMMKLYSYAL